MNPTESTGVDFTVAGLGQGASGTTTFTDGAGHQLADVAGNGSFTAGLTDGTILRASDGAGHSTTATENSVLLDTDPGLGPTLSVYAVNPAYVPAGETLELASPYSGTLSFAGATGTLKVDHSSSFSGTIGGQLAIGDVIDFADITAGGNAKISYSGNNSPGTLTVSDGTHTASVALQGNYSLANFTASSDGHGGTSVVDPPLGSVYPNATNTGVPAGTALKPSGGLVLSTPGQVINGLDINGGVDIHASNVTLENCIIRVTDPSSNWVVSVLGGLTGVVIKNCEIIGPGLPATTQTAGIYIIGDSQVTIDSVNIHEVGHGIDVSGGPVVVQNSYIHDLNAASSSHYDGIYYGGGAGANFSLHIQNNTIINQNDQTSAIFTENYFGAINNVTVNNNLLVGGGYTVYLVSNTQSNGGGGQGGPVSNVSYTNNDLGTGYWGYTAFEGPYNPVYTGNVNDGAALAAALPVSPVISTASAAAGTYSTGNTLTLTLYTSEAVKVGGTPTLTLNDGGTATYTGSSASNALTFSYTVASGQNTSALAVTSVNGTITDYDGHKLSASNLSATFTGVVIGLSGAPPAPPAAPTIASFSRDTGVVGDHITNASTLTLTGTAVANSTVKVFDGTTPVGTATANGSGQWTLTTLALSDGTHSLTATDTSSGQTGAASAAFSVTIDAHVPAAPVLVSDPIVNTNHVQLSGTAEANSTITVYDGTTVVGTGTTSSTGAWSVTTSALPSGTQALTATATDVAGTVSAASQPLDPVIPAAPSPAAPTIASFSTDTGVAGDHITSDNTPTLTGSAVANSTVAVFDGTTQVGTATANGSGQWTLTTPVLSDGTHKLTATDTSSGQTSAASAAFSVTIDTHVPTAPVLVSDSIVNTNHVQLSGTAEANSTITVYVGTTAVGTTTTGSNGTWSATTAALASGTQALTATAADVAGNVSAASQALDPVIGPAPTPPAAPQIASLSTDSRAVGDHITNDNTPMLTGTTLANSTVTVFDGMTQVGMAKVNGSGQWTLPTLVLSDGTHNLTATDTDSSGHTSASSAAFSVTIDTHAPGAPAMAVYSQGGSAVGNATTLGDLVLKGTAEANSTIDIFDGGKQIGTTTTNGSGAWSLDTGHLANGSHSFTATAIDVAGNTSAASATDGVRVSTPSTPTKPIEFTNVQEHWNDSATIKGTADASSQIKIYDGTTSLGTVTASANGTWSFTTTQLSDTLHTFKAQELDSTGHVVATSSGTAILAASNTSTLTGTGGDDFLYSSSSQLNDTFVFASNFGHSTIEGFTVAGSGQDTIQFSKTVFDSFASVLSHATQAGQDVVISTGADTLTLKNIKLGALNSHDFHFA